MSKSSRMGATHLAVCQIIQHLQLCPATAKNLVWVTGCEPRTVAVWLESFMNPRRKLIHISSWVRTRRNTFGHVTYYYQPAYSWGNLPDAPQPLENPRGKDE